MSSPILVSSIGIARTGGPGAEEAGGVAGRLSAVLKALSRHGAQGRLVHPIEEAALLAAHDALRLAGVRTPLGGEEIGVALGLEEGIDGIKAQYYRDILNDGPLGASPVVFPLTTPNTIAARISIALDLRGENVTVCGGTLSGAHALGLAAEALRAGRTPAVLAGGATSVQRDFLDALALTGGPEGGFSGCGACLFLLRSHASAGVDGGAGRLLGYGQAVGGNDVREAIQACLQDAELAPTQVGSVRVASVNEAPSLVKSLRAVGVIAPVVYSPSARLHSASFPLAVAESLQQPAEGPCGPAIVVGSDCLVGAAAAVVQGEG